MGTMQKFAVALDADAPAHARNPGNALDALLKRARRFAHRKSSVLWIIRAVRALLHFRYHQPLHSAAHTVRQLGNSLRTALPGQMRGTRHGTSGARCALDDATADATARHVGRDSHASGTPLGSAITRRLQIRCRTLPPGGYVMAHEDDADIARLVASREFTDVARAYLGCEPVLLGCHLCVDEPNAPCTENSGVSFFHFDHAGRRSLNVFVFLTDTTPDSGRHDVVRGTHRGKTIRDILRNRMSDDEVEQRFGPRIHSIHGPVGTVVYENTEALHRRGPVRARRIMLNLLFSTHKPTLSNGTLGLRLRDAASWRHPALHAFA